MALDALVVNPGRLRILTALAVEERQEFVRLRSRTQLTDGNLAAHAKRLHSAGMIDVDKQFRDGKPVTHFTLTTAGRGALELHVRRLLAVISHRRLGAASHNDDAGEVAAVAIAAPSSRKTEQPIAAEIPADTPDDDWVD